MTTANAKQANKDNKDQRRPRVGLLYLQGLAVYIRYRLADFGQAVLHLLAAPFRWVWSRLEAGWFRLKPWLARNKRRLIWSILALTFLTLVVGGGITLYLWRDEVLALAFRLQGFLARIFTLLRRRAEPVVVVATEVAHEVPVPAVSGVDGPGQ